MKISRTNNSQSELFKNKNNSLSRHIKKKGINDDFKKILENTISDQSDDWEEFRVLLPTNGHFWDNGYEDLD